MSDVNTDFNLAEEVVDEPLVPAGTYNGSVTEVKRDPERNTINWNVTLNGNGGVLSDGETPLDGATLVFKNWLPNAGDENEMSKNGRSTKRQGKINMLGRFAKDMGINMNSMTEIEEALENSEWVGMDVVLTVSLREYEGRTYNDIKKMYVPKN